LTRLADSCSDRIATMTRGDEPSGAPQTHPANSKAGKAGERGKVDALFDDLYAELRRIAHAKLRRLGNPASLNTTALVHESYLRLAKMNLPQVQDEPHFMAYAARVMRSVVVDLVRESMTTRRGGGQANVTLNTELIAAIPAADEQVLAVHEALKTLQAIDPRMASVVEMRYFVGMEMDDIAKALNVAKRTVERDWEKARSFLYAALQSG
jgi:RNA polymerase sigma factor (TIGR02999 family)